MEHFDLTAVTLEAGEIFTEALGRELDPEGMTNTELQEAHRISSRVGDIAPIGLYRINILIVAILTLSSPDFVK